MIAEGHNNTAVQTVMLMWLDYLGYILSVRVEHLNLYNAIAQAKADAKNKEIPTIFHRKDNHEWLVTMSLDNYMEMYKECEDIE